MFFNIDINYKILYLLFINYYSILDFVKKTNKIFYKTIYIIKNKYTIKESLYIATYIKDWRPELDQIPYIYIVIL